jgi:L-iditol 2-dehydrogenase
MKAVRLVDLEKIEICDITEPEIVKETDVLIRVKTVGICGSDIHYYKNGRIGDQVIGFPQTLGHEMSGSVVRVGKAVKSLLPGDRVIVDPAVSCGTCDQCKAHRPHTCRNLRFLGCPDQLDGCLAEYVVMPEGNCYLLPDRMTYDQGALCEPLAIGCYAAQRAGELAGKSILVLGTGPIGLSVILACSAGGAKTILSADRLDYRCRAAESAGALWAGNPDRENVARLLQAKMPPGFDIVFECCGKQEAVDLAFSVLKPGGMLSIIGIPEFERYGFSANTGRRSEISICHIRRQNDCTLRAIGYVERGIITPDFMITHRFSLWEAAEAFRIVSEYGDNVIKAMISLE